MSQIPAFAAQIKAKYPQYNDMDDLTLVQSIIAKYPQYKDMLDPGDLIALNNLSDLSKDNTAFAELKGAGTPVRAGMAGAADYVAGNGLQQASDDISHVENGEKPETTAGKVGEFIGNQATPAQMAIQGGLGAALEGFGPWVTDTLKGWGGDVALAAVGKVKALAKKLGLDNLDDLAQFLMKKITIMGKEYGPIVSAGNSPEEMLAIAEDMKAAAAKQLEAVSKQGDQVVGEAGEQGGVSYLVDLPKLADDVQAMMEEYQTIAPELSGDVLAQYKGAMAALQRLTEKMQAGNTGTVFSDMAKLKTLLGSLIYKHGSPLQSKAALNDVYMLLSRELSSTAAKMGDGVGTAYAQANQVYHQLVSVVEGLEGKVVDAKSWFSSAGAGISAALGTMSAMMTHNPMALVTVPAAYAAGTVGSKALASYAPQMIAQGLDAAAPLMGRGLSALAQAAPAAGHAFLSAIGAE